MAIDGEAITQIFFFIGQSQQQPVQSPLLPNGRTIECCSDFVINALANTASTSDLQNDKAGPLFCFPSYVTDAEIKLQKYTNGNYSDIATLDNNTYGTFYEFGFFVNGQKETFIGYQLNWKDVLTAHGEGLYKIICIPSLPFGTPITLESFQYCLKTYSKERAEGTVRIEYYLSGILGVIGYDTLKRDLGELNWYNAFRLPGFFGYPTASYETDIVEYNNGQRQYVEDEQEPEYTLKLKMQPHYIHEVMRIDVMQADHVFITDYNSRNAGTFIKKAVMKNGSYEPDWHRLQSKLANVEVKFKQEFNNLRKLRC